MPSSTSHRGSFDRRLLWLLFVGIAGTPLLWLWTMQTGYVLAYQACDDRSTSWVVVPTITGVVCSVVIVMISLKAFRRARQQHLPIPFLGWLAIAMSVMMMIVLAGSAIAPLVLHPCD